MGWCFAVKCSNSAENGFRVFRFLLESKERLAQWVVYIRRVKWKPTESSRLCIVCCINNI